MNNLCALCGIPGSGKTTLSMQMAERHNARLYCFDSLPNAHHPKYAESVRCRMWADIVGDLRNGHSVVVDDLHTKLKWRLGLLSAVADIPCKKILVVMDTPLEECLRRNANREFRLPDFVVEHIHQSYEPPTLGEGWEEIITV